MGTIKCSLTLHNFLKEQKLEGETFDKCIVRLLKNYPVSNWKIEKKTSFKVSDDTSDLIKEYRISDGESYENILTRLLLK